MSLQFNTPRPQALENQLKAAAKSGEILTWVIDDDGDLTHDTKSEQWNGRAWMRTTVVKGECLFVKVVHSTKTTTKSDKIAVSSVYQGRFLEMMLRHFGDAFVDCVAKPDS